MGTYLCGILMISLPSALDPIRREIFSGFIMLIFLVTFLLPVINILIFKIFGTIPSLAMPQRKDRVVPFVFITLFYFIMTYLFYWKFGISFRDNVFKFLLIMDFLVLGATMATFIYKISVHSLAICGMLGILIPLNKVAEDNSLFYPTLVWLIIAGIVMSSRLQLDAHTPREVLVGAISGFAISFVSMIVMF
jgi:membrane-associated phospholipid phosphatase